MAATVTAAGEPGLARAMTEALTPGRGPQAAHDEAARAVRTARETGRPMAEVLREREDLDVDALLAAAAPDPGEAAAQVDAVLVDHALLTEGSR
jgi:3-carboxy-cis,cis-muconate cycloisomerase